MKNLKRLTAFIVVCLALVPAGAWAESVRLERLNLMFEGNESGAAYVRHCLKGQASAQFTKNTILTTEYLLKEMKVAYPVLSNDQAIEALAKRQAQMKGPLDGFYKKNGCNTTQAQAAQRHFNTFNTMPTAEMTDFLAHIENK